MSPVDPADQELLLPAVVPALHPLAEALLQAQLAHVSQQWDGIELAEQEIRAWLHWLGEQPLQHFWPAEGLHQLLQQPLPPDLFMPLQQHLHSLTQHPVSASTTLQDLIPDELLDELTLQVLHRLGDRQQWIHRLVRHPAYTGFVSQLVQNSVRDYLEQSISKKLPSGVGSLMKMGKSVIEKATDRDMDRTIDQYVHKNIQKLSDLSEKLLVEQLSDQRIVQMQRVLWKRIRHVPLSKLLQRLDPACSTPALTEISAWVQQIQHTPQLASHLTQRLDQWLSEHQQQPIAQLIRQLHLPEAELDRERLALLQPLFARLMPRDYVLQRYEQHLRGFYASAAVQHLLIQHDQQHQPDQLLTQDAD